MRLIPSNDNSIEPRGAIGIQKCGIIFWQKTGFLRHCNQIGFNSIVTLLDKKFRPTKIDKHLDCSFLEFDNEELKTLYVSLKRDNKGKNYIYGESHTAYTDADFHLKALEMISFISKQIGTSFYVNDATNYLEQKDYNDLEEYIKNYKNDYGEFLKNIK